MHEQLMCLKAGYKSFQKSTESEYDDLDCILAALHGIGFFILALVAQSNPGIISALLKGQPVFSKEVEG